MRDLSQVVRRTPRDTPVPLSTRTSPWPKIRANRLILANRLRVPEPNPLLRDRALGGKSGESQVSGDSRESLAR